MRLTAALLALFLLLPAPGSAQAPTRAAALERALAVNPNLDGVEFQVRLLERVLAERKKKG